MNRERADSGACRQFKSPIACKPEAPVPRSASSYIWTWRSALNNDLINDAQALLGGRVDASGTTRRVALKAALGVGYAAAAAPIMAQTAIKTPATGLVAGEVTIDVNGFKMPAYRAAPAGKTGLPVVLVISEIFGVHEYIADVARRPAHWRRRGHALCRGRVASVARPVGARLRPGGSPHCARIRPRSRRTAPRRGRQLHHHEEPEVPAGHAEDRDAYRPVTRVRPSDDPRMGRAASRRVRH